MNSDICKKIFEFFCSIEKPQPKQDNNKGLVDYFKKIPDPRINHTREHKLIDILVIGVCCLLCGSEGFSDMETFGK